MLEVLPKLSDALADTIATAGPGVVRVEGRKRMPASGTVWSPDTVVTAHHVVEHDDNINVGLADGRTVPASVVGRDPTTDLAVLRSEGAGLTAPIWAEPEGLRLGHLVLALGRPGQSVRATLGIVSVLGKAWHTATGGLLDPYLESDVVMYPGFSGGPLVNVAGNYLGINTSAILRGASMAVPTPTIRRVVETLLTHGRIRRGYLGVGSQPVRLPQGLAEQVGQESGLMVVSVAPGSPAELNGLHMGDAIFALAGRPVRYVDDLLAMLSGDLIDKAVTLSIVRGGEVKELTVTIGEHP